MIRNLYCTQTVNMAVMKMLSAVISVQGEIVFTTKMLFALHLLTPTSFGEVKFWWPGLLEMCVRSISWSPYAWWIWPWCQVVDLPQDRSRGTPWSAGQDFLTLPLGLRFMDKRRVPEYRNPKQPLAMSLSFKNHGQKFGQFHPKRLSFTLGSSLNSACAWLGGDQEWKVAKKYSPAILDETFPHHLHHCHYCSSQPSMVHWLSNSIVRPAMVTPDQISLLLAPDPPNPFIFWKLMIIAIQKWIRNNIFGILMT